MSEQGSNNSMLYFLVGALLVAVVAVGYFAMKGGGVSTAGGVTEETARDTADDSGTKFKLDVDKDGDVSGTIEKQSDK